MKLGDSFSWNWHFLDNVLGLVHQLLPVDRVVCLWAIVEPSGNGEEIWSIVYPTGSTNKIDWLISWLTDRRTQLEDGGYEWMTETRTPAAVVVKRHFLLGFSHADTDLLVACVQRLNLSLPSQRPLGVVVYKSFSMRLVNENAWVATRIFNKVSLSYSLVLSKCFALKVLSPWSPKPPTKSQTLTLIGVSFINNVLVFCANDATAINVTLPAYLLSSCKVVYCG